MPPAPGGEILRRARPRAGETRTAHAGPRLLLGHVFRCSAQARTSGSHRRTTRRTRSPRMWREPPGRSAGGSRVEFATQPRATRVGPPPAGQDTETSRKDRPASVQALAQAGQITAERTRVLIGRTSHWPRTCVLMACMYQVTPAAESQPDAPLRRSKRRASALSPRGADPLPGDLVLPARGPSFPAAGCLPPGRSARIADSASQGGGRRHRKPGLVKIIMRAPGHRGSPEAVPSAGIADGWP